MSSLQSLQDEIAALQSQLRSAEATLQTEKNAYSTLKAQYDRYNNNPRYTTSPIIATLLTRLNQKRAQIDIAQATVTSILSQINATQTELASMSPTIVSQPGGRGLVKALLVGINYTGTTNALSGCINDLNAMKNHIMPKYPGCTNIRELRDNSANAMPTKTAILNGLTWLTTDLSAGDAIFFYYSGHGTQFAHLYMDESDAKDECIVPYDGVSITANKIIRDNELRSYLAERVPAGCRCFIMLDCCYSGTALDLRYLVVGSSASDISYNAISTYRDVSGDILFMSACSDNELALERGGRGVFTQAVQEYWTSPNISVNTILWDVRRYLLNNGIAQTPQMSTGTQFSFSDQFKLGPS